MTPSFVYFAYVYFVHIYVCDFRLCNITTFICGYGHIFILPVYFLQVHVVYTIRNH